MTKPTESPRSSAATLRDVAARAGVTGMTASRVVSGNGYASKATRAAVMRAVEELGYRPNMSAKAMRQQRSHSVGVLVQNNPQKRFTHPLAWEFVLGINEGLERSGYMTTLIRIDDIAEDEGLGAKAFEGHLLDGLIAVNAFPPQIEERIQNAAPHCVWLDGNVWRETHCIQRDEAWAAALAVRELAKLGYGEIVMVCAQLDGPHLHYSHVERLRGAHEAARELGVTLREWINPQAVPDDTYHGLIPQLRREEAVLMMDDYAMQAILLPLARSGVKPGIDIAIACCDDDFQNSAFRRDKISRVAFNRFDMGSHAADMMLRAIKKPDARCASRRLRDQWVAGQTASRYLNDKE